MATLILRKDCTYELSFSDRGNYILKTPHIQGGLILDKDFIKIDEIVHRNPDDSLEINLDRAIEYLINKYSYEHYKDIKELG